MGGSSSIAKHFREIHFGGNWTSVNLRDTLADVTWQEATMKQRSFNTIAAITFHIHYFADAVLQVLEGGPLDAHDKFSFDHPPITSDADWQRMLDQIWADAERFATMVEQITEGRLQSNLADPKYGTWYRNLHGIIEHAHYHMGQVVILKKLLREG